MPTSPAATAANADTLQQHQLALLDSLPDVAWLKDIRGCLVSVNLAFSKRYGIKREAAIGKTDFDIYPRDKAAQLRREDNEVIASRQPIRYESSLDFEGRRCWVEIVKSPIFDASGNVIGTVGTARDVTARRRMEEALRKVSRALKAVTECHQAMLRATQEAELLNEVCRIIVEVGGYRMAWVGFAVDDEEKTVRAVAEQGFEEGYLAAAHISWGDNERGRSMARRCTAKTPKCCA